MGPFKCPECGVWWAGVEHRCQPLALVSNTTPWGHCHGCITALCRAADHVPCLQHAGGWTTTVMPWVNT